jgi:hypothetical protein
MSVGVMGWKAVLLCSVTLEGFLAALPFDLGVQLWTARRHVLRIGWLYDVVGREGGHTSEFGTDSKCNISSGFQFPQRNNHTSSFNLPKILRICEGGGGAQGNQKVDCKPARETGTLYYNFISGSKKIIVGTGMNDCKNEAHKI